MGNSRHYLNFRIRKGEAGAFSLQKIFLGEQPSIRQEKGLYWIKTKDIIL